MYHAATTRASPRAALIAGRAGPSTSLSSHHSVFYLRKDGLGLLSMGRRRPMASKLRSRNSCCLGSQGLLLTQSVRDCGWMGGVVCCRLRWQSFARASR